tara:strand:+ start:6697 stop:7395 length:699 start_codon:yes stop_codon:yes gene_type:complete
MHKFLNEIKSNEQKPFVIKKFINEEEIKLFQKLYKELPVEINNKRQSIIKKKWSKNFFPSLQKVYYNKLKLHLENFEMDNPKSKEGFESLGLFQESFMPVSLHVDAGFDFNKIIYKQTLLPLSDKGETIIFKNRFYGCATTFSVDPKELSASGYNKRSSEHIKLYNGKEFDKEIHEKYLKHEQLDNLRGLEVDFIYKWSLGDLLIFDRSNLHCSSCNIKNKKLGLTTLTIKK